MQLTRWLTLVVALGLTAALAGAAAVTAVYREGNLGAWGVALLVPIVALSVMYRDFGKRICAVLLGLLLVSVATWIWLTFGDDFGPFALLTIVALGLLVPVGGDLMLLDAGRRVAVSRGLGYVALGTFAIVFAPLAGLLLSAEHRSVVENDYALIREVAQHVEVKDNALVFDHVDPKHKAELKNRLAVRIEGKAYPLANAHFESVSHESTVKTQTEKHGARETTVVSRQRDEDMRVVVDLDRKPTAVVLYSTRGPVTICEEAVSLPGDEDPVS
jgi:hypothetical protein